MSAGMNPTGDAPVAAPELLIVVINFRTPALTLDCLRSLAPEVATVPGSKVVVVENGSGDDSAERLQAALAEQPEWAAWVELQVESQNWGFAGGNNRAIERYPDARYVLLLNSDTIVHTGCLRHCYDLMQREEDIGVLSCKLLNADGSIQNTARRFATPARLFVRALGLPWYLPRWFEWADMEDAHWDRDTISRDVDWVGGCFMWIRGDLIRRIGSLDETFFFEGEDAEFCHRTWRAGRRVFYEAGAAITHLGGASSDPTRMSTKSRSRHRWRARYEFLRLAYGRPAAWFIRVVDVAWCAAHVARLTCVGRGRSERCADFRHVLSTLVRPLR